MPPKKLKKVRRATAKATGPKDRKFTFTVRDEETGKVVMKFDKLSDIIVTYRNLGPCEHTEEEKKDPLHAACNWGGNSIVRKDRTLAAITALSFASHRMWMKDTDPLAALVGKMSLPNCDDPSCPSCYAARKRAKAKKK